MSDGIIREARQIVRLVRTIEDGHEKLEGSISDPYGNIPSWRRAIVSIAKHVVNLYAPADATSDQKDYDVAMLLRQSAKTMSADTMVREVMDKDHPGASKLPTQVTTNPAAVQALSIWVIPGEDCEECAEPHEDLRILTGDTGAIQLDAFGGVLGQLVRQHAFFQSHGDENERLKIIAKIQKDFIDSFDIGQTKH